MDQFQTIQFLGLAFAYNKFQISFDAIEAIHEAIQYMMKQEQEDLER